MVGCVVTSYCIWYYSGRYVGELALLLPGRTTVRFSVLDFWGNREVRLRGWLAGMHARTHAMHPFRTRYAHMHARMWACICTCKPYLHAHARTLTPGCTVRTGLIDCAPCCGQGEARGGRQACTAMWRSAWPKALRHHVWDSPPSPPPPPPTPRTPHMQDVDVPLALIQPPWRHRSVAEVRAQAAQALMPIDVQGGRQFYVSVPHGHIVEKQVGGGGKGGSGALGGGVSGRTRRGAPARQHA